MGYKTPRVIVFFIASIVLVSGFVELEKRQLNIPKGFPKPVYDFKDNKLSTPVFNLGRKLFYDPILSRNNTVSCASCHQSFAAFAHIDHNLSHGIDGRIGTRNVPALQNLIWKDALMWDGAVNNLEIQPLTPIADHNEMDNNLQTILAKLSRDENYRTQFKIAFNDDKITSQQVLKALTQFVGLMISANSKYDKFINGEAKFSPTEKQGLVLFRMNCSNCHKEPLFTDNSYRNNGLAVDSNLNDLGRFIITGLEEDRFLFKVPSLRNIAVTYPYMHDGRFQRLREVIDHYSDQKSLNKNVDKSLYKIAALTDNEKKDIISFLLTLTDVSFLENKDFAEPKN